MMLEHSFDLYADRNSAPLKPELLQRKRQTPAASTTVPTNNPKTEERVMRTSIVEHSFEFKGATARDIYEALLDAQRANIWSHGNTRVSKRVGTEFELFDGNVYGSLVQAVSFFHVGTTEMILI